MQEKILTPEQVAQVLQVHPFTILKFIKQGRLKASKLGRVYRIRESDVERFLDQSMNGESSEKSPVKSLVKSSEKKETTEKVKKQRKIKNQLKVESQKFDQGKPSEEIAPLPQDPPNISVSNSDSQLPAETTAHLSSELPTEFNAETQVNAEAEKQENQQNFESNFEKNKPKMREVSTQNGEEHYYILD